MREERAGRARVAPCRGLDSKVAGTNAPKIAERGAGSARCFAGASGALGGTSAKCRGTAPG
eukprot:3960175-Alexandrium_andersonii.AAC.1